MDCTFYIVGLLSLTVLPQVSLQVGTATLTVTPEKAVSGSPVSMQCTVDVAPGSDFVTSFFFLLRVQDTVIDIVKYEQKCDDPLVKKNQWYFRGFESVSVDPTSCNSVTVSNIIASDQTAGDYRCKFYLISRDFSKNTIISSNAKLIVGDDSPQVRLLEVKQADNNNLVPNNGEIATGTNVSVVCEAEPARPESQFTITVGDLSSAALTPQPADNNRVMTYFKIPRQASVRVSCSVYNGFGTHKTKNMTVVPVYGYSHDFIVMPESLTQQSSDEIEICSLANNPAKPLSVTVKDSDALLQAGYPRFEAKDGYSRVYIKLKDSTGSVKQLAVTCGLPGIEPVPKSISIIGVEATTQGSGSATASYSYSISSSTDNLLDYTLSTPNSAMITIGIVIAVVVVFIVVVLVVAVALKRRSSANKASIRDKRYDKVGQNDADTYEANVSGKKPVTVQVDNYDTHQV